MGKKLTAIICLLLAFITTNSQTFYGVFVGISEYPYPNELPDDCVWDAEDMSYKLRDYMGWQSNNMEILTDALATEQQIKDAISAMPRTSANRDVFFFSGHGSTSGLFTVDEQSLSPSELQNSFGSTYNYFASFLDACNSGIFVSNMSKGVISSACQSDEYSYCGGPDGHSVFTAYLCQGLQDYISSAEDLHEYATPLTTAYMSSMHPQLGDYFTGEMMFATYTTSGTLSQNETWSNSVSLTGDVIVPTGITLTITQDAIVNLNAYSIIVDGGTLNVSGSATINDLRAKLGYNGANGYCGLIQTAIDNSDLNNNIYIMPGTYSEDISIYNKTETIFIYGDEASNTRLNGNVYIFNSNYTQLYFITARFLNIYNSDNVTVSKVVIAPWSEESEPSILSNSNSNLHFLDLTLSNSPDGLGGYFSSTTGYFNKNENSTGCYLENHYLATYFISNSSFYSYYTYFCGNTDDISTNSNSNVYTYSNTFSGDPDQTTYGNVSWSNYSICSASKSSADYLLNEDTEKDFAYEQFNTLNNKYFSILSGENKASKETNSTIESDAKDFDEVINECKSFILSNKNSAFASTALKLAVDSYRINGDFEGLKSFLDEIILDDNFQTVHGNALLHTADYYINQQNYSQALDILDNIISSYADEQSETSDNLVCEALLTKGHLYKFSFNDEEEAVNAYNEILLEYPESDFTVFAKTQLKDLGIESDEIQEDETSDVTVSELSINNYPNPFNPTTTISVSLPEQDNIKLIVYNLLGQEVIKLADGDYSAGEHKFRFNAAGLASGIYIYRLYTTSQSLTKKMLLLK